jgi:hypothetical protein
MASTKLTRYAWCAHAVCGVVLCAIISTDAATQQRDNAGQNCTTNFECAKVAVTQAFAARAALEQGKADIEKIRNQLNEYETTIDAKLQSLASETKKLTEQLSKIRNATGTIELKATDPAFDDIKADTNAAGLSGTRLSTDRECPPGSFVSSIQGFKPTTLPQAITMIRYNCRSVK